MLPFDVKTTWLRRVLLIILIGWMSSYSIYTSYYRAYAVDTYERFLQHQAGNSMFFNPWQYRVLCPVLIEATYQVLDHTVYPLLSIKGINTDQTNSVSDKNPTTQKLYELLKDPLFIKYTIVFVGFRMLEGVIVLLLAYSYLSLFVSNNGLRWLGLILISLFMGNGVVDSDLTFNTYIDVILYLWAGIVIIKNLNYWWIAVITIIGAFNRETSVFIPVLFFFSKVNWPAWPQWFKAFFADRKAVLVTAVCGLSFVLIFVAIRLHYGYRPQSSWRVPIGLPMLKLNLLSSTAVKTYSEFFGIFAILPIWTLFVVKKANSHLKIFFYALVPVWFALHLYTGIAFQTRLFLVPTLLVIIPVVLEYIEQKSKPTLQ